MNDEEGYLLCIDLFDSDYSEEDIAEFVMRKFLKNIRNNYSFAINNMDNTTVEDNTTVVEENIVIEETIPAVEDKPVVKKSSKKPKEEIDFDEHVYLDHFEANTNYTNQQRISIFKSEFESEQTDAKIGKIINKYFKVSSDRIGGKKIKVYQLEDFYTTTIESIIAVENEKAINEESEEEYKNLMKKIAIKNQRDNFLAKYEDNGISAIPFNMAIEVDTLYSIDEIKNIYQITTGHEMNPILHTKYFEGYPNNKTLKKFI
jgi:hypothetical protein